MRRRTLLAAAVPLLGGLPRSASAQGTAADARTLRFVPQSDLSSIDPLWSVATVSVTHGYMVWDTLFGLDLELRPQPQMCERAEVSADGLIWTFVLRPGLVFHDNEPVRPSDCIASLQRSMQKDPFMQALGALVTDIRPLDDLRWTMTLAKPFRQTLFAIALRNVFIMPERIAKTPPSTQFKEVVGSGPTASLPMSGRLASMPATPGSKNMCPARSRRRCSPAARLPISTRSIGSRSPTRPPQPPPCSAARST